MTPLPPTAPPAEIDRHAIASQLMQLFEHWQLSTEAQLDALGFSVTNRAILTKYRRGEPISASRDTLERAGHLLGIHAHLRVLFPRNADLRYAWIKTPNRAFDHRAPIEVIRAWGFAGLLTVRAYLERARGP